MKYAVQWDFVSASHGPWKEGDEVDIPRDEAAHANRESPGVLKQVRKRAVTKPPNDRMVRGAKTRSKK